jgi:hypothetical protein
MAKQALINTINMGTGGVYYAGTVIDDTEARYTSLVANGALFAPMSNSTIATAQALAAKMRAKGDSGLAVDAVMMDAYDTVQAATEAADTASKLQKRSVTIAFGAFSGLSGGTKTLTVADTAGALPTGARVMGVSIESFTGFDDATHGTYTVECGVAATNDAMAATSVAVGAGAAPKVGTIGAKGFIGCPVSGTFQAKITGGPDLNTATAGTVTVALLFTTLA